MENENKIFLSIESEYLTETGRQLSKSRLRDMIEAKELPCVVYWLTQSRWLYVDPGNAAHHETKGWPKWAAKRECDLNPDEVNPKPPIIYFSDDRSHQNLCNHLGLGGGLHLANFRPGLFIPESAIQKLSTRALPTKDTVPAISRSQAQDLALNSALRERGYDHLNLPKPSSGGPGVRAEMKTLLLSERPDLFTASAFLHTWKRLLKKVKSNSQ